jgi:hypothetical protein
MSNARRNFLKGIVSAGVLPALVASSVEASGLLTEDDIRAINPDFDRTAFDFWSNFLASDMVPIVQTSGQSRGGGGGDDLQPLFLHFGPDGFKNAAELDAGKLISQGDVNVSLNTSMLKIAAEDQATFAKLQNAQVRVDVAQKTSILPALEALAYTFVSGMISLRAKSKNTSSGSTGSSKKPAPTASGKSSGGSVQSISVASDPTWQKMQNIILPKGEGRWALNLEAQKKNSLFFKVFQNIVKEAGQFAPLIGLPGIAITALQSFNILYGALHSQPVPIIKSNPLRVFATQEAVQRTGAPGSATGILLQSGTYVLIPANKAPSLDKFKNLTVVQGRVVPEKTSPKPTELDAAAAETLTGVTYATFDVEVTPTILFRGSSPAQPAQ